VVDKVPNSDVGLRAAQLNRWAAQTRDNERSGMVE
jgi:hypothetical protein